MSYSFYQMCDFFEFLDDLRDEGSVNMYGAAPNLACAFDLKLPEARSILAEWQQTFSHEPLEDRVSAAQRGRTQ